MDGLTSDRDMDTHAHDPWLPVAGYDAYPNVPSQQHSTPCSCQLSVEQPPLPYGTAPNALQAQNQLHQGQNGIHTPHPHGSGQLHPHPGQGGVGALRVPDGTYPNAIPRCQHQHPSLPLHHHHHQLHPSHWLYHQGPHWQHAYLAHHPCGLEQAHSGQCQSCNRADSHGHHLTPWHHTQPCTHACHPRASYQDHRCQGSSDTTLDALSHPHSHPHSRPHSLFPLSAQPSTDNTSHGCPALGTLGTFDPHLASLLDSAQPSEAAPSHPSRGGPDWTPFSQGVGLQGCGGGGQGEEVDTSDAFHGDPGFSHTSSPYPVHGIGALQTASWSPPAFAQPLGAVAGVTTPLNTEHGSSLPPTFGLVSPPQCDRSAQPWLQYGELADPLIPLASASHTAAPLPPGSLPSFGGGTCAPSPSSRKHDEWPSDFRNADGVPHWAPHGELRRLRLQKATDVEQARRAPRLRTARQCQPMAMPGRSRLRATRTHGSSRSTPILCAPCSLRTALHQRGERAPLGLATLLAQQPRTSINMPHGRRFTSKTWAVC